MQKLVLLLLPLFAACATTRRSDEAVAPAPATSSHELASIDGVLDALYQSVSFGPGGECDWDRLRLILVEDALFVQPPRNGVAQIWGVDRFFDDFREFIADSPAGERGFSERIASRRTEQFGDIAHAFVVFEARFGGDEEPRSRGLDSLQLVRHGGRWWVASITTEFERATTPIPARFLVTSTGDA